MSTPRTLVELIDPSGLDNQLVKPKEVHINGVPVAVEADSLLVDYSDPGSAVKVMLTILPDQFTIRRGPRKPEHAESLDALREKLSRPARTD